jgi:hypothetical protein
MIFSIKGLVVLAAALLLFGGAFYDITTTGARCGLSVTNPNAGYDCNEFWGTLGKTVIMPDQNIGKSTLGIVALREADQYTLESLGIMAETQEASYRNQILLGIVGIAVLFLFLAYVFIKLSPSSGIDAGSLGVSVFAAFLVLSLIMVMFDNGPEPGFMSIPGVNTPFKGVRTLLKYPNVMSDIVDDTSILPGTITTDEITGEGES